MSNATPHHDVLYCWPDCFTPAGDVPLCEGHRREVGLGWVRDNLDQIRAVVTDRAADLDTLVEQRRTLAALQEPGRVLPEGYVVYYVLLGDRIKIGTTRNLRTRIRQLRVDERAVLATEPGGQVVEAARHREFATERQGRREDFSISARLVDHLHWLNRVPA